MAAAAASGGRGPQRPRAPGRSPSPGGYSSSKPLGRDGFASRRQDGSVSPGPRRELPGHCRGEGSARGYGAGAGHPAGAVPSAPLRFPSAEPLRTGEDEESEEEERGARGAGSGFGGVGEARPGERAAPRRWGGEGGGAALRGGRAGGGRLLCGRLCLLCPLINRFTPFHFYDSVAFLQFHHFPPHPNTFCRLFSDSFFFLTAFRNSSLFSRIYFTILSRLH